MSAQAAKKVLTIGEILVEIVATTRGTGFLAAQPLIGPFPSGAPAIFIDQVGRLGTAAAILAQVGDDDFGRLNTERLARDGVDISGIAISPDLPTGTAFVRYRDSGARDFVFNIAHSAAGQLPSTAATDKLIDDAGHLHIMGTALSAPGMADMTRNALRRIKGKGGTVSFDPNLRPEILEAPGLRAALEETLAATDLFLPSGEELTLFTQARDEAGAVAELQERGIAHIVLKRGAAGASHFGPDGRCDSAPIAVEEIDPTGAGDCFGGAFVALWLAGEDPQTTLRYANAAGAFAVTRLGPMEGVASRADLDALLAQHQRSSS